MSPLSAKPDLVEALVFCNEIGLEIVLAASGSRRRDLERAREVPVLADTDYGRIEAALADAEIDLLLGPSRAAATSRQLNIPLVRIGFPIQDRLGAARQRVAGYSGTHDLLDRIANARLSQRQAADPVGYPPGNSFRRSSDEYCHSQHR